MTPQEQEIDRKLKNLGTLAKVGWLCWAIVVAMLFATTFCGCAGVPPGNPGFNSCDVVVAGDYKDRFAPSRLTQKDVERGVRVTLDAATLTTDYRLNDQTENCRMLVGYKVYTMPTLDFLLPQDGKTWVSGFTLCSSRLIVVGTPATGVDWRESSLVHEFFHALQGCVGLPPEDPGLPSKFHDNWIRDRIFDAIDWAERQP